MAGTLTRGELKGFLLAVLLPFIILTVILYPATQGVHGSMYSDGSNTEVIMDGDADGEPHDGDFESSSAHFEGDITVRGTTGWVVCNGKVRYWGDFTIKDADVDVVQDNEDYYGSMFNHDKHEINIDGDEGEMEGGVPFWFLSLLGSLAGLFCWLSWLVITKGGDREDLIPMFSIIFCMFFLSFYSFFIICFLFLFFVIPVSILLWLSFRTYKYIRNGWYRWHLYVKTPITEAAIPLGLITFFFSVLSIMFPLQVVYYEYNHASAYGCVSLGYIGCVSGASLIAWGYAKIGSWESEDHRIWMEYQYAQVKAARYHWEWYRHSANHQYPHWGWWAPPYYGHGGGYHDPRYYGQLEGTQRPEGDPGRKQKRRRARCPDCHSILRYSKSKDGWYCDECGYNY